MTFVPSPLSWRLWFVLALIAAFAFGAPPVAKAPDISVHHGMMQDHGSPDMDAKGQCLLACAIVAVLPGVVPFLRLPAVFEIDRKNNETLLSGIGVSPAARPPQGWR